MISPHSPTVHSINHCHIRLEPYLSDYYLETKKSLILDRNQCSSPPMNMIHSDILQNPTLSSRLKPTASFFCTLSFGKHIQGQCTDPMIFHDKLYGSPIPALKVGQSTATVGIQRLQQDLTWQRQKCKQPGDLVGLRCSLL